MHIQLTKDLREFVESLNASGVKFLVVGAYARAFHGRPRYTADIDFFVESTTENAQRIILAIESFGFSSIGLREQDFYHPDTVVQLGVEPNRIDILTKIDGVNFGEAWESRVTGDLDGLPVFFIGLDCYLKNKRASNRPKDQFDAAEFDPPSRP